MDNPFVQLVAVIWGCSAVGAAFTRDSDTFGYALAVTIVAGLGYMAYKMGG